MKSNKISMLIPLLIFILSIINLSESALQPIYNGISLKSSENVSPKHFVLVHGAGHGGWCWYKVLAKLKSSGHNVTALDLAASGIDLTPFVTVQTISDYHKPLLDLMASLSENEKVILVAHSLGGLAISQAMEMFPDKISAAVFVTAAMPGPGFNFSDFQPISGDPMDCTVEIIGGPALIFGPQYLHAKMYNLSPIEDLTLATTLVRPSRLFDTEGVEKELVLTPENYGSVNRIFITSEFDQSATLEFQESMIEDNPPTEVMNIYGSDHLVMMSQPIQLWIKLLRIALKYG